MDEIDRTDFAEARGAGSRRAAWFFLLAAMLPISCTKPPEPEKGVARMLEIMDCESRSTKGNIVRVLETEAAERKHYRPLWFTAMPIITREKVPGYHGPTRGSYVFIVEQYASEAEAARRASEYLSYEPRKRDGQPAWPAPDGKATVRCWGLASGRHAYLLTTHASMFGALNEQNRMKAKLAEYLQAKPASQ